MAVPSPALPKPGHPIDVRQRRFVVDLILSVMAPADFDLIGAHQLYVVSLSSVED